MSTKHTPGPWRFHPNRLPGLIYGPENDDRLIATVIPYGDSGCHVANASLIKAAPEMLEALRLIEKQIGALKPDASTLIYVRAAIAKAEGKE